MRLRTVFAFVWREARTLPRHKEALFWLIAFPIFILAMCNWVWIPERHPITISVGVVYEDPGINQYPVNATLVVYALNQTKADNQTLFNVRVLGSREETIDQIRKGQLDAALVFPEGFSQNMSSGYQACLDVYVSTADPQREPIILGYLSNFLDIYNQRTQAIIIGYIT
ncbi:ABC transporter permease, partial [archaeon]|nr:ABC transporter permease [archaeon]